MDITDWMKDILCPGRPRKVDTAGIIDQLTPITPHLYLSSARAIVEPNNITDRGITCIVNATVELPNLPIPDVDYIKISVEDSPYTNLAPYFDSVADKIEDSSRVGGKCLVHCIAGVSRSASLCIAYLMKYQGLSLKGAYNHVKTCRPIVHPNCGFFKQLIEYETRLFGTATVQMLYNPIVRTLIPDVYEANYKNMLWGQAAANYRRSITEYTSRKPV